MKKILAVFVAVALIFTLGCGVKYVPKEDILNMDNKTYSLCIDFYELKGDKWGYLKGYEMHSVLDPEELARLAYLQMHEHPGAKKALRASLGGPQPDYDRMVCMKVHFSNETKDGLMIRVGDTYTIYTSTDPEVFGHEIWEVLCDSGLVERCPHDYDLLDKTSEKWKDRLPDPGYE